MLRWWLTSMHLMVLISPLPAQVHTLTLTQCYDLARENYPLTQQLDLIRKSEIYTLDNIARGLWPQVSLIAQATYQSDVTQVPISVPGMEIPVISKDQYRLYAEASHTLYDGGVNKQQQRVQESQSRSEQQQTEVELYTLHHRVQQLFFSILLLDEQATQLEYVQQDIESGLDKIRAAITYGTALRSHESVLHAERLKVLQRQIEITSARKAFQTMLATMTGIPPGDSIILIRPEAVITTPDIRRPELAWFERQQQRVDAQAALLDIRNRPKISLFVQGGIGRPGLNMLDNEFKGYFMGGIRAAWPLSGLYTLENDRGLLALQRVQIQAQRQTFLLNTRLQEQQQEAEIEKWELLLDTDKEIIALCAEIKQTTLTQMELGVATSHDYLREVNAEDQARQQQLLHEIQLLMSRHHLQYLTGQTP